MGHEYDKYVDGGYVGIDEAPDFRFDAGKVEVILRNAERPSDWPENRLPVHTSTRTGLVDSARGFAKKNPDYLR